MGDQEHRRPSAKERVVEARDAATQRASDAREAATQRVTDARDAAAQHLAGAKATASEFIERQKPRFRGVSHQWAFFVSLVAGAGLVVAAPTPRATIAVGDLRRVAVGAARGQRSISPRQLGAARTCAAGCAGSTTR